MSDNMTDNLDADAGEEADERGSAAATTSGRTAALATEAVAGNKYAQTVELRYLPGSVRGHSEQLNTAAW